MLNSILKYKNNLYLQNGEDGIINLIFNRLNINKGTFIEFGAWDGKYLSNTYNLFQNGWDGIYIEADKQKYENLVSNFKNYKDRIDCVCEYVGYSDNNNLDTLIEKHSNKRNFDFISIDVDGLDYFIFKKLNKYLPKVICIEVNAGHSPLYPFVIPENVCSDNVGQSIKVISDLGSEKGYFPLCYTGNLFLIKNEYKNEFNDYDRTIEEIYNEFLEYSYPSDLLHLKKTFVDNKIYNGFMFENPFLVKFVKKHFSYNV